jgi:hypothetical protein
VAVAVPDALTLTAGMTVTAQELGHLGFHGGLDDQPHAQPATSSKTSPRSCSEANRSSISARIRSAADRLADTGVDLLSLSG